MARHIGNMQYIVSIDNANAIRTLNNYEFQKEAEIQDIITIHPQIILEIPELQIEGETCLCSCREFQCKPYLLDALYITSKPEIVIVESKLIKNQESRRVVVAQTIEYIKNLTQMSINNFIQEAKRKNRIPNEPILDNENFLSAISEALKKGIFKVIILGDYLDVNILHMTESIQSAPHLYFTLYLAEMHAKCIGQDLYFSPRIMSKTNEVERSVITLDIKLHSQSDQVLSILVSAESPSGNNERRQPRSLLNLEDYYSSIKPTAFVLPIKNFLSEWEQCFNDSPNMGIRGFSLKLNGVASIFIYDNNLRLVSQRYKEKAGISDIAYADYGKALQQVPRAYDIFASGRSEINFSELSDSDLQNLLIAYVKLAETQSDSES